MKYKFLLILLILVPLSLSSAWLAKINKNQFVISTSDFKDFLEFREEPADSVDYYDNMLDLYISQVLIIDKAKKSGYTKDNSEVKKQFNKRKDNWLLQIYANENIPFDQKKFLKKFEKGFKQSSLKKFFEENKQQLGAANISFSDLTPQQKQQIKQRIFLEKAQAANQKVKDAYLKAQEKKIKIKRYGVIDKTIVARVGDEKINISNLKTKLVKKLSMLYRVPESQASMQIDRLKTEQPVQYKKMLQEELNEAILEKVLIKNLKSQKFEKSKKAKKALKILNDLLILEVYKDNEIRKKIKVSDSEIEEAYQKNKEMFEKEKNLDKVLDYIEKQLREEKTERKLKKIVQNIRDASIITKNDEALETLIKKLKK